MMVFKKFLLTLSAVLLNSILSAQTATYPYFTTFESNADTAGWKVYADNGSNDWEWGVPNDTYLYTTRSGSKAWVTDLDDYYNRYSDRSLQCPDFDLSDTTKEFIFSFYHKGRDGNGDDYFVEYRIGNTGSWSLLDDANTRKFRWQNANGMSFWHGSFYHSAIDLGFLKGNSLVQIRFRVITSGHDAEGWMIDDVRMDSVFYNVEALSAEDVRTLMTCRNITFKAEYHVIRQFWSGGNFQNLTRIYLSEDTLIDSSDSLLISFSRGTLNDHYVSISQNLTIPFLNTGNYYLIYQLDVNNSMIEANETDNIGYSILTIDSVFTIPFEDDFEDPSAEQWKVINTWNRVDTIWEKGLGRRHQNDNAHSGVNAWHNSEHKTYGLGSCGLNCNRQFLESPTFDLRGMTGTNVFNFWHHGNTNAAGWTSIDISSDCGATWNHVMDYPYERDSDWDFTNITLDYQGVGFFDSSNVRFRLNQSLQTNSGDWEVAFDDVYIGPAKADLSIERDLKNYYTTSNRVTDTIRYYLFNSGLVGASSSSTRFYWSNDSILDGSDQLLGNKLESALSSESREWRSFVYTKQDTSLKYYYIFFELDANAQVDEMREGNNLGYFKINQEQRKTLPYFNDFENQVDAWVHNSSMNVDQWQWTNPKGNNLDSAFSGNKCWVTFDSGIVESYSRMHLYTPVFDLSNTVSPVISFNMILDQYHTHSNMSYSIDGGASWHVLENSSQSYNKWYTTMTFSGANDYDHLDLHSDLLFDNRENCFARVYDYNSRDVKRNTRYINDIAFLAGYSKVRFRFNMAVPDYSIGNYIGEGILMDDFEIREKEIDLTVDYKKALMLGSASKYVKTFLHLHNEGNYISDSCETRFYLSTDTLLSQADHLLYTHISKPIRPDFYQYINFSSVAPANLNQYKYLLIEVDADQKNAESDETNNLIYWDLAIDSAINYPYVNNFNDSIIDGWHQYSIGHYSNQLSGSRMRTQFAPTEDFTPERNEGEWFTEYQGQSHSSIRPTFYLESPVFDFSKVTAAELQFDLSMTGNNGYNSRDGGNMEYSINGGLTWILLTDVANTALNWYGNYLLTGYTNEPGWHQMDLIKLPRRISIDHLAGNQNVQFRFKFKSKHYTYGTWRRAGFVMDNFVVNASTVDYAATSKGDTIYGSLSNSNLTGRFDYINLGSGASPTLSTTKLYWSNDSVLDANDQEITSLFEGSIPANTPISRPFNVLHPTPLDTLPLYIIYEMDALGRDDELNENNNIGYLRVIYPSYPNLTAVELMDTLHFTNFQQTLVFNYQANNTGLDSIQHSETAFYISTDSILTSSDNFIGVDTIRALQPNDSVQSHEIVQIPPNLANGLYYLFFRLDDLDFEDENDENDNTGYAILNVDIRPDLASVNFFDTLKVSLGQANLSIDYFIRNYGDRPSSNQSITEFYWSADSVLDQNDLLLGSQIESSLNLFVDYIRNFTTALPTQMDSVDSYIFYQLDATDIEQELDESNNIGSFHVQHEPYPNLFTKSIKDTIWVINGQLNSTHNYTVYNNGNLVSDSSTSSFYWSTDSILDIQDQWLFSDRLAPVFINDSIQALINFQPPSSPNGIYYLIYKLDDLDSLVEWDENDNLGRRVVRVDNTVGINEKGSDEFQAYVHNGALTLNNPFEPISRSQIELISSNGVLIQRFNSSLQKGNNVFNLKEDIATGIYFIVIRSNKINQNLQFYFSR